MQDRVPVTRQEFILHHVVVINFVVPQYGLFRMRLCQRLQSLLGLLGCFVLKCHACQLLAFASAAVMISAGASEEGADLEDESMATTGSQIGCSSCDVAQGGGSSDFLLNNLYGALLDITQMQSLDARLPVIQLLLQHLFCECVVQCVAVAAPDAALDLCCGGVVWSGLGFQATCALTRMILCCKCNDFL